MISLLQSLLSNSIYLPQYSLEFPSILPLRREGSYCEIGRSLNVFKTCGNRLGDNMPCVNDFFSNSATLDDHVKSFVEWRNSAIDAGENFDFQYFADVPAIVSICL